uniref:FBD domain-containing protein n=1 Tax=Brassica oleracea var. oleracea TaxID=109376 RepID=A0A0D3DWT2_BRAOL
MESLVEARLDLRLLESTTSFDDYTETGEYNDLLVVNGFDDIFGDATILLLRMASYVKILHLSAYSLEGRLLHRVTGRCGDVCPCYHRPKRKGVIDWRKEKMSCLPYLPLKVLEISGYGGTCREIEQMEFFLGGLQYLELVKIGVQPESDCNKLRSNLMRFPRFSSKCNIQFI